jgi:hypothetical protein
LIANVKTLSLCIVLGCALAIRAAEPLSVAGRIVLNAASSAPYALESARDGRLIAALTDPRGLVIVNEWVILQAESTDTTLRGLPVLEVIDVLPEHWKARPSAPRITPERRWKIAARITTTMVFSVFLFSGSDRAQVIHP